MFKIPFYYIMARYRQIRHFPRGAAHYYRKITNTLPDSSRAHEKLVTALYADKQYEVVIRHVQNLLVNGKTGTSPLYAVSIKSCIKLARYDEAITQSDAAMRVCGDVYDIVVLYADSLLASRNYSEAREAYVHASKLARQDEQRSYCYHSLGYIEVQQGNDSDHYFKESLRFSHDKKAAAIGIGALHFKRGWYELARDAYEQQRELNRDNAELHFELGKTYTKLLDTLRAAESYKDFITYDSQRKKEGHALNKKLVVFDAYMARNYACSPRAIYEELLNNPEYKDFTFVWIFRGASFRKHWRLYLNRRTKVVKYKSKECFRAYSRAKYWITNSRIAFVLKTHQEQVYVQCWHGTPLKRMGHSIVGNGEESKYSKDGLTELYDHETKRFDYFISPSHRASEYFSDAFGMKQLNKEDTLLEEGYPRNDFLINHTIQDSNRVKKRLSIPKNKKVLLYAPTWRDDQHDSNRGYTYKTQADFDYLQKKLGGEYVILFRAHYFIANSFNFDKYNGFIYDVSGVDDVNDLYIISDVLMTDYSSVFFDYANLRRPIIFFMYDLDHYMKNLRGFYIDLKELPGDVVKTEQEIITILSNLPAYNKKHQTTYQTFHDTFNYLDDGQATKRVVERVMR